MRKLQDILNDFSFDNLPPVWTTFDLAAFSTSKSLFDYQQEALQNALKVLWKYYEDFVDYQSSELPEADAERKQHLFQWYQDNNISANLDLNLSRARRDIVNLLDEFYPLQDDSIPYEHFINRISFWMATGSGKTLVLVKLLELLWRLIRQGELPPNDILVLTYRDDLLDQLRRHVDEFNSAQSDLFIHLRDLRKAPELKRAGSSLFHYSELTVFAYRSDNVSDEQKEKIVDFHNYESHGRWYVLLDEAHKGDREDSKRQHIYSILSRNGFLFNFSATFTDERDILATAYDFNLARFIRAGYGKHISILKQENRAFRDNEDYTDVEKQKMVLKALLMLAYLAQVRAQMPVGGLYHRPLLLTLVNSVNTKDADLKLFFRELKRIGEGRLTDAAWQQAKAELWDELRECPEWMFESQRFTPNQSLFDAITLADLLTLVYNAPAPADIEVLVRPSNRQQVAFKLKSADRPFALIKIGDISAWLRDELLGYEIIEGLEDEGFFEQLNADDSEINILMGSRSFYEGWDSNRPNVITYINIGTGTDARKFILQSVGRGVRIEPQPGKRKRLQNLYNTKEVSREVFQRVKAQTQAMETLFILGTNRQALQTVIEQLDLEKGAKDEHEIALQVNREAVDNHVLLIPTYRQGARPLIEDRKLRKFPIAADELNLLQKYVAYLGDDRLLLTHHQATPHQIELLHRSLSTTDEYFNTTAGTRYGDMRILLMRLFSYFSLVPEEVDGLKPLEDEVRHFRHIKVLLKDIGALQKKIADVNHAPRRIAELQARYESRQLAFDAFLNQARAIRDAESFGSDGHTLYIKRLANHYYTPMLLSDSDRIDYIRHIIRHPSEVRFVNQLDSYLQTEDNEFASFDWWFFSKIDETLDDVYIPYYDPDANRIRRFKPDFVFWLQKGQNYHIAFVDPKGIKHTDYQHKVDGYKALFQDDAGHHRTLLHSDQRVRVSLFLYTEDVNRLSQEYRRYWIDQPATLASRLA